MRTQNSLGTRWDEVPHEDLWRDGHWDGPPDLRFLLRKAWPGATFALFVITGIAWGFIAIALELRPLYAAPLGIPSGFLLWLGLMFAYSRGWVGDE